MEAREPNGEVAHDGQVSSLGELDQEERVRKEKNVSDAQVGMTTSPWWVRVSAPWNSKGWEGADFWESLIGSRK